MRRWFRWSSSSRLGQRKRRHALEPLEPRLVLDSTVVFSEIMYHPTDADQSLEWVELHNQQGVNMDVSGWSLSGGVDFTFPEGTIVLGGGHLVVAADPTALSAETGVADAMGPYAGRLANNGERLELRNNNDRQVDVLDYDDNAPWPIAPDGSGATLAKLDQNANSADPGSWTNSLQIGGTPGQDNFPIGVKGIVLDDVYSGGVDAGGTLVAVGQPVAGWTVDVTGQAAVAIEPDATWADNTDIAQWIGTGLAIPGSPVTYSTTFDLAGVDTGTASLSVRVIAADQLVDVLVNGESQGLSSLGASRLPRRATTIDTGFVDGANTLEVVTANFGGASGMLVELTGTATTLPLPPDPFVGLTFNEVAGGSDDDRFAEIINLSDHSIELSGLEVRAASGGSFSFGAGSLEPGQWAVAPAGQNGLDFASGDTLLLVAESGTKIIDGARVQDVLQGRSADHDRRWLTPAAATPGAANSFEIENNVVINEIFYHAPTTPFIPGMLPSYETTTYVPFDAAWRHTKHFNFGAADLPVDPGPDWATMAHPADQVNWFESPGPIGVGRIARGAPRIATTLTNPSLSTNYITAYYFETEFGLTQQQIDEMDELQLQHVIDDGAVFYVNGTEVQRVNMPEGPVTLDTLASADVDRAALSEEPVTILKDHLVALPEMNRLSVEVHQSSTDSDDIVFGTELTGRNLVDPGFEAMPPVEPAEEWIELVNRSATETVDLTGWQFTDGIGYDFPAGTQIGPGQYLVLANDPDMLQAKHPSLDPALVFGPFSGTLSNGGEHVQLSDPHGNPADDVNYRDDGRWSGLADGDRSSLELRDPNADNSRPEAWAASDETGRSRWQTYTYRGTGEPAIRTDPSRYSEFLFGLLRAGEILIDDISVIQNPGTADAVELIQNGTFQGDTVGGQPAAWRLVGDQTGVVAVDPDDPTNQVVLLQATANTSHEHNNAGTTLKAGDELVTRMDADATYEISFRAKWLSGSNQLNTRLYFNRASRTTLLEAPDVHGTPGAVNSMRVDNHGPTYSGLQHAPVVPNAGEQVTIDIVAADPDGVASMMVWYSIDSGPFASNPMTDLGGGRYSGFVPGQAAESVVQFYVEGQDARGATSTFPADGVQSRALYEVQDGQANFNTGVHNFRVIMTPDDTAFLHERTNVMSNAPMGATIVYDERQLFYDVNLRLKGSERGRNQTVRVGYLVSFDPMQPFRGVYETVGIDRSGAGNEFSQKEILVKHGIHHAGDIPSPVDDLIHVIAPNERLTGSAMLMPGFRDYFLETEYDNGAQGTVFEYELIYHPRSTVGGDPEGLKLPEPDDVVGAAMADHGSDREAYRWYWLVENNRAKDDYQLIMESLQALGRPAGEKFLEEVDRLLDVDQWLRTFAVQSLYGIGDNYAASAAHNAQFYARPDGKLIYFPYDMDFTFSQGATSGIVSNTELRKMVADPGNEHMYMGHLHDIMTTTFNSEYMDPWIDHYQSKLTSTQNYQNFKRYISQRHDSVMGRFPDQTPFAITTGATLDVGDSSTATLAGNGWINVREIRLAGHDQPLDVTWTDLTTWEATVAVNQSTSNLALEAYDFQGGRLGTAEIQVNSTAVNPVADALRITEINYNPFDPTSDELAVDATLDNNDFEFIEVQNVGNVPINLLNTRLSNGVTFTFPSWVLEPAEYAVIVKNLDAFPLRFGSDIPVIGQFEDGGLSNAGERITLVDSSNATILDFQYSDNAPWPEGPDGRGTTLQMVDPVGISTDRWDRFDAWSGNTAYGGTPGAAGAAPLGVVINEVLSNTDDPQQQTDAIELHNTTDQSIDASGWFLSDSADNPLKYSIPAGTIIDPRGYLVLDETRFNPNPENPGPGDFALSGSNGDDVWLVIPDGQGGVARVVDEVHFGAASSGESFGRTPNGTGRLTPMTQLTLGSENSPPRVGPVFVSEINFHSSDPTPAALAIDPGLSRGDLQFVEVTNPTSSMVDLTNWKLDAGVNFDFPAGIQVAPSQTVVVVSLDPVDPDNADRVNALRTHFGIDPSVLLVGPFQGQLSNDGEMIQLLRPDMPVADPATQPPLLLEDEVIYDDVAPWPETADGMGMSLTRVSVDSLGNSPTSWTAESPSPGTTDFTSILPGDANQDGTYDQQDVQSVLAAGKYLTGQPATFEQGDWNGDGVFDQIDIVASLQFGGYSGAPMAALSGQGQARTTDDLDLWFARFGQDTSQ